MNRQIGIKALAKVLKHPKNCEIFEKYIFENTKETNSDIYNWCIYQVIGLILQESKNMKEIASSVRKGDVGWKSSTYKNICAKIEEFDEYLTKPFEVVEGVVECAKCCSKKTWSIQKQTRSSDEPMTTFSRCVECGHQWAYAG